MKYRKSIFLLLVFALASVLCACKKQMNMAEGLLDEFTSGEQVRELESKLQSQREENGRLTKENGRLTNEKEKLLKELKAANDSLSTQTWRAKDFEKKFKDADAENVRLNQDKVKLSNDLRKIRTAFENAEKESAQKDALIEQLKNELAAAKKAGGE